MERGMRGMLSDEALLAGVAGGDDDSCTLFVRRYERAVYGVALRVVGDAAFAEDVAQGVFVRAWQHAADFDPRRGSAGTWLLTITRNLAVDELRKRHDDVISLGDEDLDGAEPLDTNPSDHVVHREDLRRVARAIDALPAEQRRALLLATWHGRTAAQIARLEGVPLGTAKTRIRTAQRRVRTDRPARARAAAGENPTGTSG